MLIVDILVFWKTFFKFLFLMVIFKLIFYINWGFCIDKSECNVIILSLMFRDLKRLFFEYDRRESFWREWMTEGFAHVDIEEFFHDVNILVFDECLLAEPFFESGLLDFGFGGFIGLMLWHLEFGVGDFDVMNLLFST